MKAKNLGTFLDCLASAEKVHIGLFEEGEFLSDQKDF